ncbi:uncharacterized protein si:dkeyp-51f12.2 [Osmerus mordax]|uniref:uncharacterized protein si:dkeyp-51f12.2 n=1 Tax=Osmerus mordax TaxID=8014 RepID=UPI0035100C09
MPSLHHGTILIGVFLIVTGGSTAFLTSSQSRMQAFSLCCVIMGALMLILGLFWAMNRKSSVNYTGEYNGEFPHFNNDSVHSSHVLFTSPGHSLPESQSVYVQRTLECQRHGPYCRDFDHPPVDPGCFSPAPHPPPWLGPPPPYEVAIKTTCSSTHLRRAYSDSHLASEPLFGRSREISFEV